MTGRCDEAGAMSVSDAMHDISFDRLVTRDGIRQYFVAGFYLGRQELRRIFGWQCVPRPPDCAAAVAVANRRIVTGVGRNKSVTGPRQ
jgi:hypothetical protein